MEKQKKYIKQFYKRKNFFSFKKIDKKEKKRGIKLNNQDNYLYRNKKLKKGIFLKKPRLSEVMYPFYLNIKLINEYLKKK